MPTTLSLLASPSRANGRAIKLDGAAGPGTAISASKTQNVAHPALIRAPSWAHASIAGKAVLYFNAHHGSGDSNNVIQYSYADAFQGAAWSAPADTTAAIATLATAISEPGDGNHLASADVIVDDANETLVMCTHASFPVWGHASCIWTSTVGVDSQVGIDWTLANAGPIDGGSNQSTYMRFFRVGSSWFLIGNRGRVHISDETDLADVPTSDWTQQSLVPNLDTALGSVNARHCCPRYRDNADGVQLLVSAYDDDPNERIRIVDVSTADTADSSTWSASNAREVLTPFYEWEWAYETPAVTGGGELDPPEQHKALDPCVWVDADGTEWLAYATGEAGIAVARMMATV